MSRTSLLVLARARSSRRVLRSLSRLAGAAGVALCLAGCASKGGPFTWVDDYPAERTTEYLIGVGDVLSVAVFNSPQISTRAPVRSDGKISVPLLKDVDAAGRSPSALATDIEKRLKDSELVLDPHVTVTVDQVRQISVAILGAVSRAGNYQLEPSAGLAEALATAGGLTEFAHKDRIFVLRRAPTPVRIRFTFESIMSATGKAPLFRLRTGDVIVAE